MSLQFQYPQNQWVFLILLIPVLIHLLRLRKRQTVWFPGVFRLQSLIKETQSKQRIKHWLLLINRLLLFLCIALLLTQPHCSNAPEAQNQSSIGIILDASNSMWELDANGVVPIETAKSNLVEWLNRQNPTTSICFYDRPFQDQYRFTVSELKSYVLSLSKPHGAFSLNSIWQQNNLPMDVSNWYVFSDLDPDVQQLAGSLNDSLNPWNWVDLSVSRKINYSIDTVYKTSNHTPQLYWQVSRNKKGTEQEIWMDIFADGKLLTKELVRFEPDELIVSDSVSALSGLSSTMRFEIPSDALNADNVLYTHAYRPQKLRIFLSGIDPSSPLRRLIQTFSDRFTVVDSLQGADVSFWASSEEKNSLWLSTLDRVSEGKVAVVIPQSAAKPVPFSLLNGGNWIQSSKSNASNRIDFKGFRQWPFDQILQQNVSIPASTITPQIIQYYKIEHDKNADWQRMLITEGDQDFLLHKNLGAGHIWLFTTDLEKGLEDVINSTWFVGIMLPIILSGNVSEAPLLASYNQDWYTLPFEEKFQRGDLVDIRKDGRVWASVVGLNNGDLALPKIEDVGLDAGYYQIVNKRTNDSISLAINTPRTEQSVESAIADPSVVNSQPRKMAITDWQQVSTTKVMGSQDWYLLKWLILLLFVSEVLIQNGLLKTNR